MRFIATLFLLLSFLSTPAFAIDQFQTEDAAQQAEATTKFQAPYPFTKDEFEEKLLKIMELLPDTASKDQVENILGMKFSEAHPERSFYEAKDGLDWYFSVRLWKRKIKNGFIFMFMWEKSPNQIVSPPPENMCIKKDEFRLKLEKAGWVYLSKRDYPLMRIGETRFKKSQSELLLTMDRSDRLTDCIHALWVFNN